MFFFVLDVGMDVDIDVGMGVDMDVSVAGSSHKSSTGRAPILSEAIAQKTAASHTLSLHLSIPSQQSRAMEKSTAEHHTAATETHCGTRGRRYQPFFLLRNASAIQRAESSAALPPNRAEPALR